MQVLKTVFYQWFSRFSINRKISQVAQRAPMQITVSACVAMCQNVVFPMVFEGAPGDSMVRRRRPRVCNFFCHLVLLLKTLFSIGFWRFSLNRKIYILLCHGAHAQNIVLLMVSKVFGEGARPVFFFAIWCSCLCFPYLQACYMYSNVHALTFVL